ncbi:hypothetical protein C0Q70_00089 [Pomacea canaliculata]|uniref:Apple domain-containing protein n=1 Tax=Pomacea canaliculata TaxID=400727 RepID=A0A2T7PVQ5_POMCA|nr:hypothetical protein C0Q70_00089 [Pomacea canaliculata]
MFKSFTTRRRRRQQQQQQQQQQTGVVAAHPLTTGLQQKVIPGPTVSSLYSDDYHFRMERKFNTSSTDAPAYRIESVGQCEEACRLVTQCQAYALNIHHVHPVHCHPLHQLSFSETCNMTGDDRTSLSYSPTLQSCEGVCLRSRLCKAVVFDSSGLTCSLYSSLPAHKDDNPSLTLSWKLSDEGEVFTFTFKNDGDNGSTRLFSTSHLSTTTTTTTTSAPTLANSSTSMTTTDTTTQPRRRHQQPLPLINNYNNSNNHVDFNNNHDHAINNHYHSINNYNNSNNHVDFNNAYDYSFDNYDDAINIHYHSINNHNKSNNHVDFNNHDHAINNHYHSINNHKSNNHVDFPTTTTTPSTTTTTPTTTTTLSTTTTTTSAPATTSGVTAMSASVSRDAASPTPAPGLADSQSVNEGLPPGVNQAVLIGVAIGIFFVLLYLYIVIPLVVLVRRRKKKTKAKGRKSADLENQDPDVGGTQSLQFSKSRKLATHHVAMGKQNILSLRFREVAGSTPQQPNTRDKTTGRQTEEDTRSCQRIPQQPSAHHHCVEEQCSVTTTIHLLLVILISSPPPLLMFAWNKLFVLTLATSSPSLLSRQNFIYLNHCGCEVLGLCSMMW